MRVYLAGPWAERTSMPRAAAQLELAGHSVTHRWWEFEDDPVDGYPSNKDSDALTNHAINDFIGVVTADVVVLVNSAMSEGKAVETGIAIAGNKPIVLVGVRSNLFHYLPNVHIVDSVDAAVELLAA